MTQLYIPQSLDKEQLLPKLIRNNLIESLYESLDELDLEPWGSVKNAVKKIYQRDIFQVGLKVASPYPEELDMRGEIHFYMGQHEHDIEEPFRYRIGQVHSKLYDLTKKGQPKEFFNDQHKIHNRLISIPMKLAEKYHIVSINKKDSRKNMLDWVV